MTAEDIEAYLPESRKVAPVQQSSMVVQLAPGVGHGITLQPDEIVQHYPGNPVLHDPVPQPGPSYSAKNANDIFFGIKVKLLSFDKKKCKRYLFWYSFICYRKSNEHFVIIYIFCKML